MGLAGEGEILGRITRWLVHLARHHRSVRLRDISPSSQAWCGPLLCFARLCGRKHVNTNKREGVLKTVLQNLAGGDRLHQKGPGRRSSCLQNMRLARSSELLRHVFTHWRRGNG